MPLMAPNATTPSVVTIASPTSIRSMRQNSRKVLVSNSDSAANTSSAPKAAFGTYCRGPVKNRRTAAIAAAVTRPVTWVRPPEVSATAVRESAPVTANPCEMAEARLAAPKAASSRSASTS